MNKRTNLIALFSSVLLLSSCGLIYDGDSHLARENMWTLVDYIENDEKGKIKELFSPIIISRVTDLDSQIDDMCEFVDGEYQNISSLGLGVTTAYEDGKEVSTFDMCYTIGTTSATYYYCILWKVKDDYVADNIGIWSIVVEEKIGDNLPTPIGDWVDGITIRYPSVSGQD